MIVETIFYVALFFIIFVGVPIWMFLCIRRLYHTKERDKTTVAIGNMLQELDRLVARPSVEFKVETEHRVETPDDDKGGE
jgi:hypothetical protein